MLYFDRKRSLTCMKMRARTTRPSTDGSAPGSPLLSRLTQPVIASGMERSSTSRENSPARSGSGSLPGVDVRLGSVGRHGGPLDVLVGGGGRQAHVTAASGRDQLDDLGGVGLRRLDLGGHPAEVERRDAIGDLHDVVHVVGDQHDAAALVGEPPDQVEDLPRLRHTEGGRRLVEEDHLAVPEHRLGDGDGLPLTTREVGHQLTHRRHGADREAGERLARLLLHLSVGEERVRTTDLAAEKHVLGDVEVVGQGEVLVDELDPERGGRARVVDRHRLALEEQLTAVDAVDAREALDQRGLAGAVVTDQCGDLAGIDVEVHVVEHVHGAEALVELASREDRFGHEGPPIGVWRGGAAVGRPGAARPPSGVRRDQEIPRLSQSDSIPLQISSAFSAPASMTSCTLACVMTLVGSSSACSLWSGASGSSNGLRVRPAVCRVLALSQDDGELGGRIGLQRDVLEDRHALLAGDDVLQTLDAGVLTGDDHVTVQAASSSAHR